MELSNAPVSLRCSLRVVPFRWSQSVKQKVHTLGGGPKAPYPQSNQDQYADSKPLPHRPWARRREGGGSGPFLPFALRTRPGRLELAHKLHLRIVHDDMRGALCIKHAGFRSNAQKRRR